MKLRSPCFVEHRRIKKANLCLLQALVEGTILSGKFAGLCHRGFLLLETLPKFSCQRKRNEKVSLERWFYLTPGDSEIGSAQTARPGPYRTVSSLALLYSAEV